MATGKTCAVEGCVKILNRTAGRICQAHRSRWHRHRSYEISPNWRNLRKGERCVSPLGYVRVNVNGKRILEHRHIMEQHLGRPLTNTERIHHKNHDKTDNRIENLELMKDHGEHLRTHHRDTWKHRKVNGPYTASEIESILTRVNHPKFTFPECFCGRPYESRNLCSKHYQWAHKHKFT